MLHWSENSKSLMKKENILGVKFRKFLEIFKQSLTENRGWLATSMLVTDVGDTMGW